MLFFCGEKFLHPNRLRTLYTRLKRITPAPPVLPQLLAQDWPVLITLKSSICKSTKAYFSQSPAYAWIFTGSSFRSLPKILHCCPHVGARALSQSRCDRPVSQIGYGSAASWTLLLSPFACNPLAAGRLTMTIFYND